MMAIENIMMARESEMAFADFIRYAAGAGVSAIVAVVISVFVEYWPWYSGLSPKLKRLLFFVMSFVVPVLAAVIGCLTGVFDWSFYTTFWPAIVAGFAASGIGTLAHTPKLRGATDVRLRR